MLALCSGLIEGLGGYLDDALTVGDERLLIVASRVDPRAVTTGLEEETDQVAHSEGSCSGRAIAPYLRVSMRARSMSASDAVCRVSKPISAHRSGHSPAA